VQLASFERDAERLLGILSRVWYLHLSGQDASLPLPEVFGRFTTERWREVFGQLHDLSLDPRQLNPLLDLAATLHIDEWTARATSRLYEAEAASSVVWRDEIIPLRAAPLRIALEFDRGRRHEIEELAREQHADLEPLSMDVLDGRRAGFAELQAGDELTVRASTRAFDVDALSTLARSILDRTAELYADALRDQLVHHRLDGADVWESDLAWILRGSEYDRTYPSHRLMPGLLRTLGQFGIRLDDQSAIRLDRAARPLKVGHAFCAPLSISDEIVAVMTPAGGRLDYADLFEQVGIAERYGHADRTQPLATRRLGDPSVIRAYGLVFRRLTGDPTWLLARLEAEATRDESRVAAFEVLAGLRRDAAEWLYVRELASADLANEAEDWSQRYADELSVALGVRVFATGYLDAIRDPLRGLDSIRAALLAKQLTLFLAGEYDETWFESERAGRFIVDRWREGQRYSAEEMARFLGFDGLDAQPLLDELTASLVG